MIELFDVDLENKTLTRITHGFEGEDERSEELPKQSKSRESDPYHEEQGAYSPSFSEDGNTLCFASSANNLVYGDGNDAPDAFVVHREQPPAEESCSSTSRPTPPSPSLEVPWKLGLTAVSLADGSVRLYADVPGAGALSAQASSKVLVRRPSRMRGAWPAARGTGVRTVGSRCARSPARTPSSAPTTKAWRL